MDHEHCHDHNHPHEHDHDYLHAHQIPHSHGGEHPHVHQNTKAVLNRMARIIGHMESVRKMVENDRDCTDVLIQLSAVSSALQGVSRTVLKEHMSTCIVEAVQQDDMEALQELNDAIDKFMK